MKTWPLILTLLCTTTPALADKLVGTVDLNNQYVSISRDGEPYVLQNKTLLVEVEADLSGDFDITTTVRVGNKKYSAYAMCDWEDNDTKTDATCTIEGDGGQFKVIADWGELPGYTHGTVSPEHGMAFNRMFLKFDNTEGTTIGREDENEKGVGAEYILNINKETLTLPVKLKKVSL